jgi:nicotinate-nucleotide pyrophosphorylase (carboxylating)
MVVFEVDSLAQLEEALGAVLLELAQLEEALGAVLLDNMSLEDLKRGVAMIDGHAISEAFGRVTLEAAGAIAKPVVDLISVGWLTHCAPILDIGLGAACSPIAQRTLRGYRLSSKTTL